MSESKSNAAAIAIRDTLLAHLFENDDAGAPRFLDPAAPYDKALVSGQYHMGSGVTAMAAQAPAIWIDDKGSRAERPSVGGMSSGGTLIPGWVQEVYNFDLEIWMKGRQEDDDRMRHVVNEWRDGVQACLRTYWHLDDSYRRMICEPGEGDPATDAWGDGSVTFWMGTVRATVAAMVAVGAATLS